MGQIFISKRDFLIFSSQSKLFRNPNWVTLTGSEHKKWFARPNLSLIKNGWYYHYQWQINYQLRPNMRKCPILGIYFAWLHCWTAFLRISYRLMCCVAPNSVDCETVLYDLNWFDIHNPITSYFHHYQGHHFSLFQYYYNTRDCKLSWNRVTV